MQLTPEQQQQVDEAKAAGARRVDVRFSAEQKAQWRAAIAEEMAGKLENLAHFRKIQAATEQAGFFGDVRRAIVLSRRPVDELAAKIGVEPRRFSDFRANEAELPPAALDKLIELLGLRLMQEIPR